MEQAAFGKLLRDARERARLTLDGLAKAAGVSVRAIGDMERGRSLPRQSTLNELLDALALDETERRTLTAAARRSGSAPAAHVPQQLPPDLRAFHGRQEVLAQVLELGDNLGGHAAHAPVIVVGGMAGVGKTSLAVHGAHRVADRFPDGQLYVNLRGFDPSDTSLEPDEALGGLLTALGVPGSLIPEETERRSALFRERVSQRRMIVLLDNARDSQQVRPLLPRSSGCLTIITSRNHLTGLATTDDARLLDLGLWTDGEAVNALSARIGTERVADDPASAVELVRMCGHLPLAVTILGAHLAAVPALTLGAAADKLAQDHSLLHALTADDPRTDLGTVFSWSYQALDPAAARVFRHLAVLPGPVFSAEAVASTLGEPVMTARRLLSSLVTASLLKRDRDGRFVIHALVRDQAGDLLGREHDDRLSAELRLLDYLRHNARRAARALGTHPVDPLDHAPAPGVVLLAFDSREHALAWFEQEEHTILAALLKSDDPRIVHARMGLAQDCIPYFSARGQWTDEIPARRPALNGAADNTSDAAESTRRRPETGHSDLAHRSVGRITGRVHGLPELHAGLVGRAREREILAQLLRAIRAGESRALVLCGDPGIGKSALLDRLVMQADGFRVLRVLGVQSEMELVFAGLHQLCAPLIDRLDRLPAPQREALRTAFGLSAGPAPKLFLVGLAVLGLLCDAAGEQPVLCVVDDLQWLDRASAEVLGFVARRLGVDAIGMVFGTRKVPEELSRIAVLLLAGLPDEQALQLLESELTEPLDAHVRDQIIIEAGGNPLALLEWLRSSDPRQPVGGFGLPGTRSLSHRIEDAFRRQLELLPTETQQLLLVAAADASGDMALVWRAAAAMGISRHAAAPAVGAGLATFGTRVRFRHPLLRSAVYLSASTSERRQAHLALVEATDPAVDPDRRVWHRAHAAEGPDEAVAADLERSADRAHARGGAAAAGAFLARAGQLSTDATRRVDRFLAAAQANLQAGAYRTALDLLADVEVDEPGPLQHARVELLRGHIAFASGDGNAAPAQLLRAAQKLTQIDLGMAREAYLDAWMAAVFAGGLAGEGALPEVCLAVRRLPASTEPGKQEQLLNTLAMAITEGPSAAQEALRNVVELFTRTDLTTEETLRWGWYAHSAAVALWDHEAWRSMLERQLHVTRAAGAYDLLPIMLSTLSTVTAWCGDFAAAEALIAEGEQICDATGSPAAMLAPILLACLRGDVAAAIPLIDVSGSPESSSRFGIFLTYTNWAAAVLHNGLGQHEQALAAAVRSYESAPFTFVAGWALPELVEAAARVGDRDLAAKALAQLEETALPGETAIAQGLVARSRALLREGSEAEQLYRVALDRLERTQLRPELGRAHLLFGEWLRSEGRESEARVQLRTAHDQLTELGTHAFAERARRELLASGEQVSHKEVETGAALTTQESLIARLAGDGFSNSEIGAQLFLSARTVDWHLRKALTKLGVTSRGALPSALARLGRS